MKKVLAILLTVLCIFGCMSFAVSAGDVLKLSVDSVTLEEGKSVNVCIRVSENPGIVACRISVQYDAQKLTLTAAQNGDVFASSLATFGNSMEDSPYTMLWLDALASQDNTSTGTLATLTFTAKESTATGDYPLTISVDEGSLFNAKLQKVSFATQNGNVHFESTSAPVLAEKITLPESISMNYGETKLLNAVVTPKDAENGTLVYKSLNTKVATVDASGKVTAHKKGTVEIKVSTQDGTVQATCKVTVKYTFVQSLIIYVLFGWIWYLK